jgi:hypothetical protein
VAVSHRPPKWIKIPIRSSSGMVPASSPHQPEYVTRTIHTTASSPLSGINMAKQYLLVASSIGNNRIPPMAIWSPLQDAALNVPPTSTCNNDNIADTLIRAKCLNPLGLCSVESTRGMEESVVRIRERNPNLGTKISRQDDTLGHVVQRGG